MVQKTTEVLYQVLADYEHLLSRPQSPPFSDVDCETLALLLAEGLCDFRSEHQHHIPLPLFSTLSKNWPLLWHWLECTYREFLTPWDVTKTEGVARLGHGMATFIGASLIASFEVAQLVVSTPGVVPMVCHLWSSEAPINRPFVNDSHFVYWTSLHSAVTQIIALCTQKRYKMHAQSSILNHFRSSMGGHLGEIATLAVKRISDLTPPLDRVVVATYTHSALQIVCCMLLSDIFRDALITQGYSRAFAKVVGVLAETPSNSELLQGSRLYLKECLKLALHIWGDEAQLINLTALHQGLRAGFLPALYRLCMKVQDMDQIILVFLHRFLGGLPYYKVWQAVKSSMDLLTLDEKSWAWPPPRNLISPESLRGMWGMLYSICPMDDVLASVAALNAESAWRYCAYYHVSVPFILRCCELKLVQCPKRSLLRLKLRCSGCMHVFYCSKECQRLHWRSAHFSHRNSCLSRNKGRG